jgi:hypothetical protein
MPTPALAALDTDGKLAAGTRRALVRVGIGIAIREGAPKPDITTPDALRKTLLAQQKITYSDSKTGGLSGINAQKVLQNLGITDDIKSKLLPHSDGQGLIAKGEADLGLYNVSEIPRAKGVVLLGPVPAAVQAYITYDAGVPASNASPSRRSPFSNSSHRLQPHRHGTRLAWSRPDLDHISDAAECSPFCSRPRECQRWRCKEDKLRCRSLCRQLVDIITPAVIFVDAC